MSTKCLVNSITNLPCSDLTIRIVLNLFFHGFIPSMHGFHALKTPMASYDAHIIKLQVEMILDFTKILIKVYVWWKHVFTMQKSCIKHNGKKMKHSLLLWCFFTHYIGVISIWQIHYSTMMMKRMQILIFLSNTIYG